MINSQLVDFQSFILIFYKPRKKPSSNKILKVTRRKFFCRKNFHRLTAKFNLTEIVLDIDSKDDRFGYCTVPAGACFIQY